MLALLASAPGVAATPEDLRAALADASARVARGDVEAGLAAADAGWSGWPADGRFDLPIVDAVLSLAASLHRQGAYDDCAAQVDRVITAGGFAALPRSASGRLLQQQASCLTETGELERAFAGFELARRHLESDPSAGSSARAIAAYNHARLLGMLGRFDEADEPLAEAERLLSEIHGPAHWEVADVWGLRAAHAQLRGDLATAGLLYERAIVSYRDQLGPHDIRTAGALHSYGTWLAVRGDRLLAASVLAEAWEAYQASYGPKHPQTAFLAATLGNARYHAGDPEGAATALRAAVDVLRPQDDPRPSVHAANALMNLGMALGKTGHPEEGLRHLEQAEAAFRRIAGEENPYVAWCAQRRAPVLRALGRLEEAQQASALARRLAEQAWGPIHDTTASIVADQAIIALASGDRASAIALLEEALDARRRLTLAILGGASDRHRRAALTAGRRSLGRWLGLTAASTPDQAWEQVRWWKGLARRANEADRALGDHTLQPLREAREALAAAVLSPLRGDPAERQAEISRLTHARDALERELAADPAALSALLDRAAPGTAALARALPAGTVLVDFVRYEEIQVRDETDRVFSAPYYGAFVLAGGDLSWVPLGPAGEIDRAVERHRALLTSSALPSRVDASGEVVRRWVWDPIAERLGAGRRVLVVPEGALTGVAFAALPRAGGGYLVEDLEFGFLEHPDDTLAAPAPLRLRRAPALVVGDVRYGERVLSEGASRSAGCLPRELPALPATAREAEDVARRLTRRGARPTLLMGSEATEHAVSEQAARARLVHVASHGFFASSRCDGAGGEADQDQVMLENPLVLSGLALAPSDGADGLWTAEEMLSLDLHAVQIAVLSACDTGRGVVDVGEGVLGLRRALGVAGVDQVVMSLWAIPDAETQRLMASFYGHLRGGRVSPASALRAAQLERLAELRADLGEAWPGSWGAFIASETGARAERPASGRGTDPAVAPSRAAPGTGS